MKKNKFLATALFLLILKGSMALGQSLPLKEGDAIPNLVLTNLYNSDKSFIKTADLRGKIVIIDFWNTWCSACIVGLKKMDALQKKYEEDIVVLPVNEQAKNVVAKFWRTNAFTKNLSLPTIVDDTVFHRLFPHAGVPHMIWINREGKFFSATTAEYANQQEIERVIKGSEVQWVQMKATNTFDFSRPLLKTNITTDSSNLFYSGFLPYAEEYKKSGSSIMVDSANRTIKITSINNTILGLYNITLKQDPVLKYPKARLIELRDTTRIKYSPSFGYLSQWRVKNQLCYELFWPLDSTLKIDKALEKMRADLDAYLGYTSTIKKIPKSQYVLSKIKIQIVPIQTNTKTQTISLTEYIHLVNFDQKSLPFIVNDYQSETDKINVELHTGQKVNIETLNAMLASKGFEIKKEIREQPIFQLIDRY